MSAAAVTIERWHEAQRAEQSYWDELCSDSAEFARTLDEKVRAASWAALHLPGGVPEGERIEIGIGPLGVGCAHFLPDAATSAIVGVEPLPLLPTAQLRMPAPLVDVVLRCQSGRYTHVQARGEDTGLEAGRFSFAICYNVLDHVHDPRAILAEIARVSRPGAFLLLGCDTVSLLSLARFHAWVKHRAPDSIGVRAHPFRFRTDALIAMVQSAGFTVRADNRRRPSWLHDAAGRAHRLLLLCEKTTDPNGEAAR